MADPGTPPALAYHQRSQPRKVLPPGLRHPRSAGPGVSAPMAQDTYQARVEIAPIRRARPRSGRVAFAELERRSASATV
jgi:hypothetical protein